VEGWLDKSDAVLLIDAARYFTQRIDANRQDDDAFHCRGVASMCADDYGSAIKDLSEAIRLNPKAAAWWNSRGTAYRLNKDYDKAIADYDEAVRLDPKYAAAHNNRGIARAKKKDYDKALADFNEAMRLDPKDPVAFNSAAWLLSVCPEEKVRNGKKAIELANKACELTHWKRQGYIDTLAAAHAEAGQFDEAVKYQLQALADAGYQQRHGPWARKVLEMYKNKKPYREE
jgi:tetratricopeptide (TPR) repeat protein